MGGNAVKFTQRGEVSLEVKALHRDGDGIFIRCEVRDTGIGIPADRQAALFTPFTQVDASTTRRFGGTGLGLSIVRRLVELMGGQTGVDSELGQGSTFWFTAQLGIAAPSNVPLYMLQSAMLHGLKMLVVDDNATNRKVIMGQLFRCGIDPSSASAAEEALVMMRSAHACGSPFVAALLDHEMPDCDGAELGRQILQDQALSATRLVVLTSSGQRGDGQFFADIGFAGYLMKPVTQRDLTECLKLVLGQNPAASGQTQAIVTQHEMRAQLSLGKNRILLAEDNVVNTKVATRLLEKLGYCVDVALNGRVAVAAWQAGSYNLILMDCQMPEHDGYEATAEIRRLESGARHIPIIALTAHAMEGAGKVCIDAGMDDYLSKPIDRATLAACLARYLGPPSLHAAAEPEPPDVSHVDYLQQGGAASGPRT